MKFSIIITSFRQSEYLKEAIQSCINQDYLGKYQIIVVDDSGKEYPNFNYYLEGKKENIDYIYIKNEKNLGVQKSFNIGYYYLNNDIQWVIKLDGDDQLLSNALLDLDEFLKEHDNRKLGFVHSNLKIMGTEKIRRYPEWKDGSIQSLQNIGHLQAIKKSVADEIGGLDVTLKYGHDTDQIIRVIEKGYQIKHIDKVLYYNRLHENQYTQKFVQTGNDPQYWKNLIFQRSLRKRPDLWIEGRQNVIMETAGSHLWRSEVEAIQKWVKGLNWVDIGCSNRKKLSYAVGIDLNRCGGKCPEWVFDEKEGLPFKEGTLDGIIASHCIEHIENPIETLEEWGKLLKKEGRLILVVPDVNFTPRMNTEGCDPTHRHDWVPETFKIEVLDKLNPELFKVLHHAQIGNGWSFLTILERV